MSFRICTIRVGQLSTNCYLVIDSKTSKALIIDPGDDGDYIIRICNDEKCRPELILATHGHFDHILAVTELKLAYDIPFYINKNDEFLVKNMQDSAKYFLGIEVGSSPVIDQYLEEEQIISLGQSDFRIVETPGHTPGSVCFHCQKNNFIFTGDLLFADGGVGRTDFSYSKPEEMGNSLAEIFKLPGKTVVYPGHGRSTTLAEEKKQQKW